jgi:hypothetical protein
LPKNGKSKNRGKRDSNFFGYLSPVAFERKYEQKYLQTA